MIRYSPVASLNPETNEITPSMMEDINGIYAIFNEKFTVSDALYEALELLLSDIQEYQRINNLGGENNHAQLLARAALAKARGEA